MIGRRRSLAAAIVCAVALACFWGSGCARRPHTNVTLAGSTAFQPFAEKLAEHFLATHQGIQVNVQGGGSAVGIQSALTGAADIGMADLLDLPKEAASLNAIVVARDGIAIVVHPKNPIRAITADGARGIFSGAIMNWKELGGVDGPIRVISREEGSGTRRSFDKLVLKGDRLTQDALFQDSNGTSREAVANDPNAIGYVSIGMVNDKVKALTYDGVPPLNANVRKGKYELSRPIYFLTKGDVSPNAQLFIDYVLSPEAQRALEKEGLVAVKE